jgi:hypothetical protein
MEIAMWALQLGLLLLLMRLAAAGARNELERALNPATLLAFFYTLWMLIPQTFVLTSGHPVIGMESVSATARADATFPTQCLLVLFLVGILVGYATSLGPLPAESPRPRLPPLQPTQWHYGAAAYLIGVTAFLVLGQTLQSLPDGTMRSALVKNTTGQVLMTLSFFGSFGVAYLGAHLWLRRQRWLAAVLFLAYGYLVLQLGARGRILWPLVTAILFVWGRGPRIRIGRVLVLGVIALMLLSLLDPLVFGLRKGDYSRLFEALSPMAMFENLFYDRNFDGFANLMFITYHDLVPHQATYLLTGSRDAFMTTYFPAIYEMGVAFPTSVPGEFWLAGGAPMLAAMSLIYGLGLGLVQRFMRGAHRESQVWVYLLLVPWLTAVGGELVESVQKMVAAAAPALLWIAAGWLRPASTPQSVPAIVPKPLT